MYVIPLCYEPTAGSDHMLLLSRRPNSISLEWEQSSIGSQRGYGQVRTISIVPKALTIIVRWSLLFSCLCPNRSNTNYGKTISIFFAGDPSIPRNQSVTTAYVQNR